LSPPLPRSYCAVADDGVGAADDDGDGDANYHHRPQLTWIHLLL